MKQAKDAPVTEGGDKPLARVVPPIAAICRAKPMPRSKEDIRCLVDSNVKCVHRARNLGLGNLCLHPRRLEIVRRTVG